MDKEKSKTIAIIAIWAGIAIGSWAAPDAAGEFATAGFLSTILIWMFG